MSNDDIFDKLYRSLGPNDMIWERKFKKGTTEDEIIKFTLKAKRLGLRVRRAEPDFEGCECVYLAGLEDTLKYLKDITS